MSRLIDADELFVKWQTTMMKIGEPVSVLYILAAMSDLQQAPTVDAVPVTRCKDCKWFDMSDPSGTVEPIGYRCKKVTRLWREPDDYCKGAERKEE